MADDLGPYEIAYLCGGRERVVQVALLQLHDDRRIRVSRGTHRVEVTRGGSSGTVQNAVLEQIPGTGLLLGALIEATADSDEVRAVGRTLRDMGLLRERWLTRNGRALRQQLQKEPGPASYARFAAQGSSGLDAGKMREVFETPDPKPMKLEHGWSGRGTDTVGGGAPDRSSDFGDGSDGSY
ncbi:TIGR04222 domain-containing membrane protein [Spirillospora sp. NPDC048911]|uniref:TIGR04222 domain-containing membrane protein n=1 Tax=Spirillospora sp. NPDC048911 TaxID=3364527 RepID=UPI003718EF12